LFTRNVGVGFALFEAQNYLCTVYRLLYVLYDEEEEGGGIKALERERGTSIQPEESPPGGQERECSFNA